jgi:hypothetical protein
MSSELDLTNEEIGLNLQKARRFYWLSGEQNRKLTEKGDSQTPLKRTVGAALRRNPCLLRRDRNSRQ